MKSLLHIIDGVVTGTTPISVIVNRKGVMHENYGVKYVQLEKVYYWDYDSDGIIDCVSMYAHCVPEFWICNTGIKINWSYNEWRKFLHANQFVLYRRRIKETEELQKAELIAIAKDGSVGVTLSFEYNNSSHNLSECENMKNCMWKIVVEKLFEQFSKPRIQKSQEEISKYDFRNGDGITYVSHGSGRILEFHLGNNNMYPDNSKDYILDLDTYIM